MERLRALAATARVANVPSVVSNIGVGIFLGAMLAGNGFRWEWCVVGAGVVFYIGGNFLNDWMDFEWDKKNRPERALPRGLFRRETYLVVAVSSFLLGLGLLAVYGMPVVGAGCFLVASIVVYTLIHKRTAVGVLPMGLCRALLPLLGFMAMGVGFSPIVLYPAAGLLLYIVALTMSARWEGGSGDTAEKRYLGIVLLVLSGVFPLALPMFVNPYLGWLGFVAFGFWLGLALTKYRTPTAAHVSALLAGIPLLDWIVLFPLATILLGHHQLGVGDLMFWLGLLLPPVCFVLGRFLQQFAPAT